MFPIIDIFGRQLGTYAIMAIIGALLVGLLFCRRISKLGLDDNEAIVFLLICSVGVLLGGGLLYGITNLDHLSLLGSAKNLSDVFEVFKLVFGGSVFYGGLIGSILAGLIYIKAKKLDMVIYSDNISPFIPLFHSIARVGCFLGGCCYGIESPFGFTAHGNMLVPQVNDVSRFPVQLLEALLNFILYLVLLKLLKSGKFRGKMLYIYLMSYACIRFFDEFLRGDEIRGFVLFLSTSQFISILIGCTALALFIISLKHDKRENQM
ncbi:MAG: prolipoprotein diacylglyceryl transferase [Ruminococcaceae bacterium]|nr:prolipoprotein diacylglyceryl transferase [Oscillospiraceae bacterium]